MAIEIDIVCTDVPDLTVACRVADVVLLRCLEGHRPLEVELGPQASGIKGNEISLTVVALSDEHQEFPEKSVMSVAPRRETRSFLACLVVSAALGCCFDGWISTTGISHRLCHRAMFFPNVSATRRPTPPSCSIGWRIHWRACSGSTLPPYARLEGYGPDEISTTTVDCGATAEPMTGAWDST
jgi:hypothetical protein